MSNYEAKIQKELDKHDRQWCDAVCPSVAKFGRQADNRIAELEAERDEAKRLCAITKKLIQLNENMVDIRLRGHLLHVLDGELDGVELESKG